MLAHSISLLTIVTSHTFLITLSINIYFFFIENQTSDSQENANLCFSPIFPDGEELHYRQKHQLLSYYPYLQLGTHYLKTAMQYLQILFMYVVHLA